MEPQDNPEIYAAILRAEIERAEQRQRHKRIDDVASINEDELAVIEDIVLLRAVEDLLKRVWHKEDRHYRHAMWNLGKLALDLRKSLRESLKK